MRKLFAKDTSYESTRRLKQLLILIGGLAIVVALLLPAQPSVASWRSLGTLNNPPLILARDGAASARVGGHLLWFFGDTIVKGLPGSSNTAALADPATPSLLHEPLDPKGAPAAFLPFTAEERQFNDSTGNPEVRIALWPGSVIPDGDGGGIVYYLKLRVDPGFLNYTFLGTGVARVADGQTVAVREPSLLFAPPEPLFDHATVVGADVYVYGALPDASTSFAVARVPLAQVTDRSAYRFWDGRAWVTTAAAVPVMEGIPGGMSVSYNPHLGQYLAVHSGILTNTVFMRVAKRPEGPWSDAVAMFTGLDPAPGRVDYAGSEHPELATDGGRKLVVSYYRPLSEFTGEVHLVEVTLQ